MKNGPPVSAVITPTGASPEPIATRAIASHIIKKEAPTTAAVGKRTRGQDQLQLWLSGELSNQQNRLNR